MIDQHKATIEKLKHDIDVVEEDVIDLLNQGFCLPTLPGRIADIKSIVEGIR